MFIRLRRQKSVAKAYRLDKSDCISAILVKCERIGGQPRQKYLCYLGTIRERHILDNHIWVVHYFYSQIEKALLDYGLSESEVSKLVSRLEKRIPRYTEEQVSQALQTSMAELRKAESRIGSV